MPTGNLANANNRIKKILRSNNKNLQAFLKNETRLKLARNLLANMNFHNMRESVISKVKKEFPMTWRVRIGRRLKNVSRPNHTHLDPVIVRKYIAKLHQRLINLNSGGRSGPFGYTIMKLPGNNGSNIMRYH